MASTSPTSRNDALRRFLADHRRALIGAAAGAALVVFALAILPQLLGLGDTVAKARRGNKTWLLLAVGCEVLSVAGYITLFRAVFVTADRRLSWRASYQITLAGTVATKMFSAAGAGGIALTAWALRSAGLEARDVARRMASFQVLLYTVYMAVLMVVGVGLAIGAIPGGGPRSLTVLPAGFAAVCCLLVVGMTLARRRRRKGTERPMPRALSRVHTAVGTVSRTACEGISTSAALLRHPRPGHLGAVAYWAFDLAALWAALHAFGVTPPLGVVVMSYFVGMLANVLPLPGGIGGVEGGMVGCLAAFGIDPGIAAVAVLSYRAISFWLPTLPGIWAYFGLRRTVASWRRPAVTPSGSPDGT
jgi:uncharacterized membrane protein YbhN (UPF0104 family)